VGVWLGIKEAPFMFPFGAIGGGIGGKFCRVWALKKPRAVGAGELRGEGLGGGGSGLKGSVKGSPVMNGCPFACTGVHLSLGSTCNNPLTKSQKERLFCFSFSTSSFDMFFLNA
jgi:hypothetical protein